MTDDDRMTTDDRRPSIDSSVPGTLEGRDSLFPFFFSVLYCPNVLWYLSLLYYVIWLVSVCVLCCFDVRSQSKREEKYWDHVSQ